MNAKLDSQLTQLNLKLDHIVHFVRDANETAAQMRAEGFHVAAGGRHSHWGTYNSLCHFGLPYVELLAVEDWQRAQQPEQNDLIRQTVADLQTGEGLGRIAIRTHQIEALAERLKSFGLQVEGPVPGQRQRPDGRVLRWSLLFASSAHVNLPFPFFIQWEDPDEHRKQDLEQQGVIQNHPLGPLHIEEIWFVTRTPEETSHLWGEWLGLTASTWLSCHTLNLDGIRLVFCSPEWDKPSKETFLARGERPWSVILSGGEQDRTVRLNGAEYLIKP